MPESQPFTAITDDDVSMLRALKRLLTSAGFVSETYTSAEEVLRFGLRPGIGC
jgi:FixJ family two-component response regulator